MSSSEQKPMRKSNSLSVLKFMLIIFFSLWNVFLPVLSKIYCSLTKHIFQAIKLGPTHFNSVFAEERKSVNGNLKICGELRATAV